jgi:4-amino-4-deoxy-L-arabinose transferase-like glycosyltransferase
MKKGDWQSIALIGLMTLLVHLPPSITLPLIDRDEPRFAQAAVEMSQSGEWVVPTFNGEWRLDKPILSYWMMRIGYHCLGHTEVAFRLHSILGVWLTACLIHFWIRESSSSSKSAWIGSLAWIVCFQNLVHGHLALADMLMVFCVVWVQWLLWRDLRRVSQNSPDLPLILQASIPIALGFLAKGPIAWIVPSVTFLLLRYGFHRKPLPLSLKNWGMAFGLALLWISLWGIPALIRTGGDFFNLGIKYHVIERGIHHFNGRRFIPFYYFFTIWISLFPFSGHLVWIVRGSWRDSALETRFLLSWLLASLLIFSFYGTQLPHYLLPSFPAFFILWGNRLSLEKSPFRGPWIVAGFSAIAIAVLWIWGIWIENFAHGEFMKSLMHGLAIILALLAGLHFFIRGLSWQKRSWAGVLLLCFLLGMAQSHLGKLLTSHNPSIRLSSSLEHLSPRHRFQSTGFQEPSLLFYNGGQWIFGGENRNARDWTIRQVEEHRIGDLLCGKSRSTLPPRFNLNSFQVEGFNPARFSWVTLEVTHDPVH